MPRDDFSLATKEVMARRVGMRCSNPNCRQPTSGPRVDPTKAVNVGVASHITAACEGGPRYDPSLSKKERQSIENGIWLCARWARFVDDDPARYPVGLLQQWKRLSEEAALLAIESGDSVDQRPRINDADLIRFYAQCFDRPAFQDHFRDEGSMEAFDTAMEDTLTAINTGCLRSRDGAVLSKSWGKAFLTNPEWRRQMDVIADLLRAIRSRYADAKSKGVIHVHARDDGTEGYCIHDQEVARWMDSTRAQMLEILSAVCAEAGVGVCPTFPRPRGW